MNRSKIEWCDHTWNPITGCKYDCKYCYARKKAPRFAGDVRRNLNSPQCIRSGDLYELEYPFTSDTGGILNYPFGFEPTLHNYRFDFMEKIKCGCNILVGEDGDMFGEWIPDEWIKSIFEACQQNTIHKYMFLTRNPERYITLAAAGLLPEGDNFWYGQTVDGTGNQKWLQTVNANTFICIEPIQERIEMPKNDTRISDWIIIGAEKGNRKGKVFPDKRWISEIVDYARRAKIPVFMKNSIKSVVGEKDFVQDYPPVLLEKEKSPKIKERLEGKCNKCGKHMRKNEMIALCGRSMRGEQPKQFAYLCDICFTDFCQQLGIGVPELKKYKEEGGGAIG